MTLIKIRRSRAEKVGAHRATIISEFAAATLVAKFFFVARDFFSFPFFPLSLSLLFLKFKM